MISYLYLRMDDDSADAEDFNEFNREPKRIKLTSTPYKKPTMSSDSDTSDSNKSVEMPKSKLAQALTMKARRIITDLEPFSGQLEKSNAANLRDEVMEMSKLESAAAIKSMQDQFMQTLEQFKSSIGNDQAAKLVEVPESSTSVHDKINLFNNIADMSCDIKPGQPANKFISLLKNAKDCAIGHTSAPPNSPAKATARVRTPIRARRLHSTQKSKVSFGVGMVKPSASMPCNLVANNAAPVDDQRKNRPRRTSFLETSRNIIKRSIDENASNTLVEVHGMMEDLSLVTPVRLK